MPSKTIPINGERLRIIRKGRMSWTQEVLAEESDVSRSYIAEIESGKKKPTIRVAKALAQALDVGLEDLISS